MAPASDWFGASFGLLRTGAKPPIFNRSGGASNLARRIARRSGRSQEKWLFSRVLKRSQLPGIERSGSFDFEKNDPAVGQRESKQRIPLREQMGLAASLDQAEVRRPLSARDVGDSKTSSPMVSCVARFAQAEPSSDWPEKAAAASAPLEQWVP